MGAMTGGILHNVLTGIVQVFTTRFPWVHKTELADVPAYAMIGAACVLAALFRAPLTGSLVLFELTRDYDVILPLMASAGVACVVSDQMESIVFQISSLRKQRLQRDGDDDTSTWNDVSDQVLLPTRQKRKDSTRRTVKSTLSTNAAL